MLHEAFDALKVNGVMIIGVPNCVRLVKRISVVFGRGKWSDFDSYYHNDVFRGHVREPDVDDLHQIAKDLNIIDYKIIGRNWNGTESSSFIIRFISKIMDVFLRPFPSLCDCIYLVAKK